MPYVGGSLTTLFDEKARVATRDAAFKMARRGIDRMHDHAARNTPVRTGNLRTAWFHTEPVKVGYVIGDGYQAYLKNEVEYAPYVEYGTGIYGPEHRPYVIVPKDPNGFLAWRGKDGHWVFAKKVLHPGSPGNHMLALAAHFTEAELRSTELVAGVLAEWQRVIEEGAR
jgi:hypothetical protein